MTETTTWAVVSEAVYLRLHELQGEDLRRRVGEAMAAVHQGQTLDESRAAVADCHKLISADLGVGAIHDGVTIRQVDGVNVTADVVEPRGTGPHPILVYVHGGGFIGNRARDYRHVAFRFAELGLVVFNIDYRLAPEAPFPAGLEDCEAAVRWVARVAPNYGGDPSRLVIGGDSAGANLSAAVATRLATEHGAPNISAALLLYGIYDNQAMLDDGPYAEHWRQRLDYYLGPDMDDLLEDPRVSPLKSADKLPPSYVAVGSADSLCRQQSADLVTALRMASIPHEYTVIEGLPHGFITFEALYPEVRNSIKKMVAFLNEHLPSSATSDTAPTT